LGKTSSSPEEISTTENPSQGSLSLYGVDDGSRGETSGEEADGREELVGEGGGKMSLNEDEDLLTLARERLMPLLFCIVDK
jgi:hypothetical protein